MQSNANRSTRKKEDFSDYARQVVNENSHQLEWLTILWQLLVHIAFVAVIVLVINHQLNLWLGFMMNIVLAYYSFGPIHDAAHNCISGRENIKGRQPTLDYLFGCFSSFILIIPYPAFRLLHLKHHAHTNDPQLDPDYYVKADTIWKSVWNSAKRRVIYTIFMKPRLNPPILTKTIRNAILSAVIMNYGSTALLVYLSYLGFFFETFFLWYLPSRLAVLLLEIVVAYLPHHPHQDQSAYKSTRIRLFPGSSWLLFGHDHHAIHHLFPRVPSIRMPSVYKEIQQEIENNGIRVDKYLNSD